MAFCWFTSFIGYPNFFKQQGAPHELAQSFRTFAKASLDGTPYSKAKGLFPDLDPAQVETKKAAFQEYGLLYVIPRSDEITLTPVGEQIYDLTKNQESREKNRRTIILALSRALSRYQFNNPLPVGGNKGKDRAESSDVLPYLACFYLMLKLGGIITVSELRGAIFGLHHMSQIRTLVSTIQEHRDSSIPFSDIKGLPTNEGTANNLKIYFLSHLSLDFEIMKATTIDFYGSQEQAFEITELGYEIIESILDEEWPNWKRDSSRIPVARNYASIADYFSDGVGKLCSRFTIEADTKRAEGRTLKISSGILDIYDVENLKELPKRNFEEGKKRLVRHTRLEKIRNSALVREAKRLFKKINKRLYCEICDFDFEHKYGRRGKDYIEAHHKIPISELADTITLTIDDLVMVCSNCHRMLHRPPWIKVEDLKSQVKEDMASGAS